MFTQRGVIDLPSRQTNDYFTQRKQKNVALVAIPAIQRTLLLSVPGPTRWRDIVAVVVGLMALLKATNTRCLVFPIMVPVNCRVWSVKACVGAVRIMVEPTFEINGPI